MCCRYSFPCTVSSHMRHIIGSLSSVLWVRWSWLSRYSALLKCCGGLHFWHAYVKSSCLWSGSAFQWSCIVLESLNLLLQTLHFGCALSLCCSSSSSVSNAATHRSHCISCCVQCDQCSPSCSSYMC